mmetsp:Transcript_26515/g.54927  ORF Transcript_26515/g.54927 Transcript_26515/m.54927 type:complete len:87 (-) Transcript_26515:35-295(-)
MLPSTSWSSKGDFWDGSINTTNSPNSHLTVGPAICSPQPSYLPPLFMPALLGLSLAIHIPSLDWHSLAVIGPAIRLPWPAILLAIC